MADLHVELVSPERQVWSGTARSVLARTVEGEIGVLPGHAPLLGELVPGLVQIRQTSGDDLLAAVHGGFLSVTDAGVSILAEQVELGSEIDPARARAALERSATAGDDAAGRRATVRLQAANQTA